MFRRLIVLAAMLAAVLGVISGSSVSPATAQASCSAAYPDFCIPPPPPDINCPALLPNVNFTALAPDPHGLDTDNDGIACEDPSRPRFPTTTTTAAVTGVVLPPANPTPALTTQTTMAGATATTSTTVAREAAGIATGLLDRTG